MNAALNVSTATKAKEKIAFYFAYEMHCGLTPFNR